MDDLRFGLEITAVGMGLVFGLLGLLWAALSAAGWAEQALARRRAARGPGAGATPAEAVAEELPPEAVAAIAIAVLRHAHAVRPHAAHEVAPHLAPTDRWVASGRGSQVRTWTRGR